MFAHEPYAGCETYVDAVVMREGELTFTELACKPELTREMLPGVAGLAVTSSGGWIYTPERPTLINLDAIASPFQMSLMPRGAVGYLETYRGCPMSCAFCEWGVDGGANATFSREYLIEELRIVER